VSKAERSLLRAQQAKEKAEQARILEERRAAETKEERRVRLKAEAEAAAAQVAAALVAARAKGGVSKAERALLRAQKAKGKAEQAKADAEKIEADRAAKLAELVKNHKPTHSETPEEKLARIKSKLKEKEAAAQARMHRLAAFRRSPQQPVASSANLETSRRPLQHTATSSALPTASPTAASTDTPTEGHAEETSSANAETRSRKGNKVAPMAEKDGIDMNGAAQPKSHTRDNVHHVVSPIQAMPPRTTYENAVDPFLTKLGEHVVEVPVRPPPQPVVVQVLRFSQNIGWGIRIRKDKVTGKYVIESVDPTMPAGQEGAAALVPGSTVSAINGYDLSVMPKALRNEILNTAYVLNLTILKPEPPEEHLPPRPSMPSQVEPTSTGQMGVQTAVAKEMSVVRSPPRILVSQRRNAPLKVGASEGALGGGPDLPLLLPPLSMPSTRRKGDRSKVSPDMEATQTNASVRSPLFPSLSPRLTRPGGAGDGNGLRGVVDGSPLDGEFRCCLVVKCANDEVIVVTVCVCVWGGGVLC